ncbi:conjugative transposon protein TraM [Emticicia sp. TH156]|uniref:conjugative transposon protein TraM n=1 Tax=Emticicia sp. TH156 TaxID=2067454 RepID=UPI000C75AD90|nr:conjugative transposon protein TraM [Emticicia sp. TH156]PLK44996.1 conjugative transposon protein TraM [Emticicia sp. TH156]
MKNQVKSPKQLRQRKFLMILPALVLPFITLMFWALGGGKVQESNAQTPLQTGLLLNLPDAALKDDHALTKLDFYNQAQADSTKLLELMKNDPNYRRIAMNPNMDTLIRGGLNPSLNSNTRYNDPNEEKIYQKLAQLDQELNDNSVTSLPNPPEPTSLGGNKTSSIHSTDIDRLEQMMKTMADPGKEDEEMKQINNVLETILDIQHPERVQLRSSENIVQQKGSVYPVTTTAKEIPVSLLNNALENNRTANGFYSLTNTYVEENVQNAIEAVIHETQTLVNGSTVKLRLINEVVINGVNIPKDNFLFGTAQLNGERLEIRINGIRYNQSLFPVDLSVYDLDGLAGIYIPGAISRDVTKESADRSIQTMGLNSLDPSWGAQAATAGIEAAKTLLSRKVKLVKVTVKAGYQVLLRDEKQK